jgi:hypothetical protein
MPARDLKDAAYHHRAGYRHGGRHRPLLTDYSETLLGAERPAARRRTESRSQAKEDWKHRMMFPVLFG